MHTTQTKVLSLGFRWLVAGLTFLASVPALAAGADNYPAPATGDDLLRTERAHTALGHLRPFGRLSLAYAKDPIVLRASDGTERGILDHQLGAHASAGIELWRRAHIAIVAPLYFQSGEGLTEEPAAVAFGDLALDLRLALLRRDDLLEVALAGRASAPTGSEDDFVGDGGATVALAAIVSREFGEDGLMLTSSVGTKFRPDNDTLGTGSELLLSLGALLPVANAWALSGEAAMSTVYGSFFSEVATPASLLGGIRYLASTWTAHLGAGPGLSRGVGSPDYTIVAMVGSRSSFEEPAAPEALPEEPADTDGDGLSDSTDQCPDQPEDFDAFEDEDGCPEADNDGDGVLDAADRCPSVAEDRDGFQDDDGCVDEDNDRDGILDEVDACPLETEDLDGWMDDDGCPEQDNDLDGVLDPDDQCPNEKETPNGLDDADGCPDLLRVEQAQIRTLEPIYFDTGSARIQERSRPLLTELASVIAARADLGVVAIEGHTDSRGNDEYNLKLSTERANAVRMFLVENGVSPDRLTAVGRGESQPITTNDTAEGRDQNRRVEFRLAGAEEASATEDGGQ